MNNNGEKKRSDEELIHEAFAMDYIDWSLILGMIEEAEEEETKKRLRSRMNYLYHLEEAACGCL